MVLKLPLWKRVLYSVIRREYPSKPIKFCGSLPKEGSLLIVPPENPFWLGVSLRVLLSVLNHFEGDKFVWGSGALIDWWETYEIDAQQISDPRELDHVEILIDFSPPPTPHKELPEFVNANYRISFDPESYPYYNIIVAADFTTSDPYMVFCKVFDIEAGEITVEPPPDLRRRAWDFLVYKGHTRDKHLVFLDTPISDLEASKIESTLIRVTYVSTSGTRGIDISKMEPLEQLAFLSLSDLYIGDESFFFPMAMGMKIPCLLKREPLIQTQGPFAMWLDDTDLTETLEALLKS